MIKEFPTPPVDWTLTMVDIINEFDVMSGIEVWEVFNRLGLHICEPGAHLYYHQKFQYMQIYIMQRMI